MKIAIASDLHLDFGSIKNAFFEGAEDADILIIAGDTAEIKNYNPHEDFFLKLDNSFRKVHVIAGNHEGYDSSIEKVEAAYSRLNDFYRNITFGNKQVFVRDGILFVGSTLWTNFDNGNPIAMQTSAYGMNDYALIEYKGGLLTPNDTLEFFNDEFAFIKTIVEHSSMYEKIVVFSHHGPSYKSIAGCYVNDTDNPAYVSELSEFILDNPKIKLWIHGHTHEPCDYMIGEARIVCHPRGYKPHRFMVDQVMGYDAYKPKVVEV